MTFCTSLHCGRAEEVSDWRRSFVLSVRYEVDVHNFEHLLQNPCFHKHTQLFFVSLLLLLGSVEQQSDSCPGRYVISFCKHWSIEASSGSTVWSEPSCRYSLRCISNPVCCPCRHSSICGLLLPPKALGEQLQTELCNQLQQWDTCGLAYIILMSWSFYSDCFFFFLSEPAVWISPPSCTSPPSLRLFMSHSSRASLGM